MRKILKKVFSFFGLRTIKTVIAVILSTLFMQYVLKQNPFFACVGAVVAMEKTIFISIKTVVRRNAGTIIGGLIGILLSSLSNNIFSMSLGLMLFIILSNIIGRTESIIPGVIVYFAFFYLTGTNSALEYGLTRMAGALAGTIIALVINLLIFPPKPIKTDTEIIEINNEKSTKFDKVKLKLHHLWNKD